MQPTITLRSPYTLGGRTIPNRVVFQPMEGCDCGEDGAPSALTIAKYHRAARSGAGIIWFEANAVCPEGRTNPRQMMLTADNLPAFAALLTEMREIARAEAGVEPVMLLQLTHSGRQSIWPIIAYRNPVYEAARPLTDDHIAADDYLDTLPARYAASARLALAAGFDGVDVKSCHGYLFQELLSAFDRPGRYGGSFENRTRLYLDSVRAVRGAVQAEAPDFLVASRLGLSDMVPRPYGFGTDCCGNLDLTEPDRLVGELMALGVRLLNVTVGNPYYNPHINRPFRAGGYTPPEPPAVGLARFETVERHLKEAFPGLAVVGSGVSYYRGDLMEQTERLVREGICDFVGYGRASLAYPMLWRDYLRGEFDGRRTCVACSKCTALMRAKCVSGCAVFNETYKLIYEENVSCKK